MYVLFHTQSTTYIYITITVTSERFETWNKLLRESTAKFASQHVDATTMVFSSYKTFSNILEKPVEHGFEPDDVRKYAGGIWVDHIHPTSKVHWVVARDIAEFLDEQSPNE